MALPRPRRAGAGPGVAPPEPRLRAEPAALQGSFGAARAPELRLRFVARARAVGARPVRLSRADCAELRRHLLQQLLQDRPAADRAAGERSREAVRRNR